MAQSAGENHPGRNGPNEDALSRDRLDAKIRHARLVMVMEDIWPRLWLPAGIIAIFLLVSALGFWPLLPKWLHITLLTLFAIGLLAGFLPLLKVRLADRTAAIRWLEKKSGIPHRPATVLDDHLAGARNPETAVLWQEHKKRAARDVRRMKAGVPHPHTERFDPLALRVPLVLALATIAGLAGHRFAPGVREAFMFDKSAAFGALRIDAWVTPPAYTGTPPVMLIDAARENSQDTAPDGRAKTVKVPEMSQLVVRISGPDAKGTKLVLKQPALLSPRPGAEHRPPARQTRVIARKDGSVRDLRVKLNQDIIARLNRNGKTVKTWHFKIAPDHPPAITLVKKPQASPRGAVRLSYRVADDYGVVAASAHIRPSRHETDRFGQTVRRAPASSSPAPDNLAVPLGTPPVFPLHLPKGSTKRGTGSTYKDLTAHPWAGLEVEVILEARDEAGKTGKSRATGFRLPERKFNKPLARSIIGQRRALVEKPINRREVAAALDELTMRSVNAANPDMTTGVYLGLRSAYWRLLGARTRPVIRSVVDQLWEIALTIEDGNLSTAERALRNAQDRLMDALSKNADSKEIARRMKELREALANFLRAMAKKQQNGQENAGEQQSPGNQRTLTSRELDKMLRNIEKMAQTGARDAARQMLSQLREMLENLDSSRPRESARGRQMRKQLDQLGKMIMQQRRLLDETHKRAQQRQGEQAGERQRQRPGNRQGRRDSRTGTPQQGHQSGRGHRKDEKNGQSAGKKQGSGQGQNREGRPGRGEGAGGQQRQQAGTGNLQQRQGELLDNLNELMDRMGRLGVPIPQDLMRAGTNMGRAEQRLGKRQLNSAGRQQGKALENLRKGATELAEKMMRQGQGKGRQSGRRNRDPLGRAQRTNGPEYGDDVKVPREIDTRRARDILEELRRRLGQSTRPPEELDYLERLIEQF